MIGRKAATIDPVVDGWINPYVQSIDLLAFFFRIQVEACVGCIVLELIIHHPDDLGRLVVNNVSCFLVPEHRDGNCAFKVRIALNVGFAQILKGVKRVTG